MTETKLAKAAWHAKPKKPKVKSRRLDERFEEWAKRNSVDLKNMKLMEKTK